MQSSPGFTISPKTTWHALPIKAQPDILSARRNCYIFHSCLRNQDVRYTHFYYVFPLQESTMTRFIRHNLPTLKKTASYYLVHISVAALVAYAVTGNLLVSLTLSLLEPTVQAVAFFCHEKVWERMGQRKAGLAAQAQGVPA